MLIGHPWLLWELEPGAHRELGVMVHVNSRGMRDPERGVKSRPRAMALGDSCICGYGVEDTEVFTALLEQQVDADFVNAAVPGYSSFQSLNLLKMRGLAMEPDLLLIGNLWSDTNFDAFRDEELLASYAGWEQGPAARLRGLAEHSFLFRWFDWKLRVEPAGEHACQVGWQVGGVPKDGRRRVPLERYIAALEAMAATMDGRVVFIELPNREDLHGFSQPAWAPYRRAMESMAHRWGDPLVEGPFLFQKAGLPENRLFIYQMHPSAEGHRLLANAVATVLSSRQWPEVPWVTGAPEGALPEGKDDAQNVSFSAKLHGPIQVPEGEGTWVVEAWLPEEHRILGVTNSNPPQDWVLPLKSLPQQVMLTVYLDQTGDGGGAGDPSWTLGPLPVPADGRLSLDPRGRTADPPRSADP